VLAGLVTALAALVVATAGGLWWRGRDGRFRVVASPQPPTAQPPNVQPPTGPDLTRLGVTAGTPVTLLQFSSAFCAPCRVTRRVCAEVAERFDSVAHVEVDAESHLDAVRELAIWRTPTVLVVDGAGRVVHRASGTPSQAQLSAVIAALLPAGAAR
jgi:thiol-disulfide isomerase/thioredoxin